MSSKRKVKRYRLTKKGKKAAMMITAVLTIICLCFGLVSCMTSKNYIAEEFRESDISNKTAGHKFISEVFKKEDKIYALHYPNFDNAILSDEVEKIVEKAKILDEEEITSHLEYSSSKAFDQYISVTFTLTQYTEMEKNTPIMESGSKEIYSFVFDEKNQKFLTLEDCLRNKAYRELKSSYDESSLVLKEIKETGILVGTNQGDVWMKYDQNPDYFKLIHDSIPSILEYPVIEKQNRELNDKPRLAFTFDDGPTEGITKRIVDLFDQYNGRATFFALGSRMEQYPDILRYVVEHGHEVGSHSYDHPDLSILSWDEVNEQLGKTEDIFYSITGQEIELLRPTYGNVSQIMKENIDITFVFWTIDSMDWNSRNTQAIVDEIIPYLHEDAIILMHDLYESSADAIESILPQLADEYQFVTVSELLEAKENESRTQD